MTAGRGPTLAIAVARPQVTSDPGAGPLPEPVEGAYDEPLRLGPMRLADPPIPYRAYEVGRWRFAWAGPGIRFRLSPAMIPSHFALTLELLPNGQWRLREMKPFETDADARSWAESLWRAEAAARRRSAP